jgi:hypothetical protein
MAIKGIRLKGEWQPGRVRVYGTRHTVLAEAVGYGLVTLVYEIPRPGQYRFLGVERPNPLRPSEWDSIPYEWMPSTAVAPSAWKRAYEADRARRNHYA